MLHTTASREWYSEIANAFDLRAQKPLHTNPSGWCCVRLFPLVITHVVWIPGCFLRQRRPLATCKTVCFHKSGLKKLIRPASGSFELVKGTFRFKPNKTVRIGIVMGFDPLASKCRASDSWEVTAPSTHLLIASMRWRRNPQGCRRRNLPGSDSGAANFLIKIQIPEGSIASLGPSPMEIAKHVIVVANRYKL